LALKNESQYRAMPVYTVHEPPVRGPGVLADPARFAFVRDGFYWWAFLLTPLWMLRHRLWLALALYLVLAIGIEAAMHVFGASATVMSLVIILISLLAGLEGGTLRRFGLRRRRWEMIGVVAGADLEDAERRFFDAWVRRMPTGAPGVPPPLVAGVPPAGGAPPTAYSSGVIGLFPEPGGTPR
jgi:hypothetical protein